MCVCINNVYILNTYIKKHKNLSGLFLKLKNSTFWCPNFAKCLKKHQNLIVQTYLILNKE